MKEIKITVTYEAHVPDDVTIDEVHERFEDYIDQDMNMLLIRDGDRDCEQIEVRLKQWQTRELANSSKREMITIQE